MKIISLLSLILVTGCSTTYVSAPKTIYIEVKAKGDVKIESNNTGSDLKGAQQNQSAEGKAKIPLVN